MIQKPISKPALASVDHSTAGAIHAIDCTKGPGRVWAYLIAGHHAGLPDWDAVECRRFSAFNQIGRGRKKNYSKEALGNAVPEASFLDEMPKAKPVGVAPVCTSWMRCCFPVWSMRIFLIPKRLCLRKNSRSKSMAKLGGIDGPLDNHDD